MTYLMTIFTFIMKNYQQAMVVLKANPIVAGAVSLWGLGVVTFIVKDIPNRIISFFKYHFTTSLIINNDDDVYDEFIKFISPKQIKFFVRSYQIKDIGNRDNDYIDDHDSPNKPPSSALVVGYGTTYFFFEGKFMVLTKHKEEANQTVQVKESVNITLFGRDTSVFEKLVNSLRQKRLEETRYLHIYQWKGDYWRLSTRTYKRSLDTVTIPSATKEALINHINSFKKSKDWHINNGIPWRTGILLQGPPGTGKTSLIKALCTYFDTDLYMIDTGTTSDSGLKQALASVPEGSIAAIEEIDMAAKSRVTPPTTKPVSDDDEDAPPTSEGDTPSPMGFSLGVSLSGMLNALDGLASGDGRIVIATTNFPERLDPALVREGRFDLKLEIGYMTDETLRAYIMRLYPDFKGIENYSVKPEIAPCKVQKLVFDNRNNPMAVLEEVAVKKSGNAAYEKAS